MHKINRNLTRLRVYIAGPLFNTAERDFNFFLANKLENWFDVFLPQRDGGLISDMICDGISVQTATTRVFHIDLEAIRNSDFLLAILDGRTLDEGMAFELGVAYSESKCCIGLQTDTRRLAPWGNNPMITGALEQVFDSVDDLLEWFKNRALANQRITSFAQNVTIHFAK